MEHEKEEAVPAPALPILLDQTDPEQALQTPAFRCAPTAHASSQGGVVVPTAAAALACPPPSTTAWPAVIRHAPSPLFYGRARERALLQAHGQRVLRRNHHHHHHGADDGKDCPRNVAPELLLVTAENGMGKTALLQSLMVNDDGDDGNENEGATRPQMVVVSCGDDDDADANIAATTAYAPWDHALTEWLVRRKQGHHRDDDFLRQRIQPQLALPLRAIHPENGQPQPRLATILPSLANLVAREPPSQVSSSSASSPMPQPTTTITNDSDKGWAQFPAMVARLITALATPAQPLWLCLDDLHAANSVSLAILDHLLRYSSSSSSNNCPIVVMGALVPSQVGLEDDLAVWLREWEDHHGLVVTQVSLTGLSAADTLTMVADQLHVPRQNCTDLASTLYQDFQGHPGKTRQKVREWMSRQSLDLTGSHVAVEYPLDTVLDADGGTEMTDVRLRIQALPESLQTWLSVAALVGKDDMDPFLMELAVPDTIDFTACAQQALQQGLIKCREIVGQGENKGNFSQRWIFVNEEIRQVAAGLVSPERRNEAHLNIAYRMWKRLSNDNSDGGQRKEYAITVATHLVSGIDLLSDEQECVEGARILLLAAEQSNLASSFQAAATFLNQARKLLPSRTHWRDYYQLSLEIFSNAAETEYVLGHFDQSDELCSRIFENGREILDTVRAYSTQMYSLGARTRYLEAIDVGWKVMDLLGEPLPKKAGALTVFFALWKVDGRLRRTKDILQLPRMTDPHKVSAMQILNTLFVYTYAHSAALQVVVSTKMINLTLDHGLMACSAVGIAFHAVVLCTSLHKTTEAHRVARAALDLFDAFFCAEYTARVYVYVHGVVLTVIRPVSQCFPLLHDAYQSGMATGDKMFASFALHVYNSLKTFQGIPLHEVLDEAVHVRNLMIEARQEPAALLHEGFLQAVAGIAGQETPCATINGVRMTREKLMETAVKDKNNTVLVVLHGNHAMECFWNAEYNQAVTYFQNARNYGLSHVILFFHCVLVFLEGMSNFLLVLDESPSSPPIWGTNKRQRMRRGRRSLHFLRKIARDVPANLLHFVHLLEGTQACLGGKWELSMNKYKLAEERVRELDLWAEQGLTHELIARTILRRQQQQQRHIVRVHDGNPLRMDVASSLQKARDMYIKWGAVHRARAPGGLVVRIQISRGAH